MSKQKNHVYHISSSIENDMNFYVEVFGVEAVKRGYAREADRIYVLDNSLTQDGIDKIMSEDAPKSILNMPLPPLPEGELVTELFTMDDGTVVSWIKHPYALPKACREHWREHLIHIQMVNEKLEYEAHHSIHRFAIVEANDGLPKLFAPGGVRWVDYPNRETMISDVLDMSIAVSMKIEVVHTPSAGSKVAIIGNKKNTKEILASVHAVLERLGLGITAADLGISTEELDQYAVPVAPTSCVPVGVYRDGMPSSVVTADGVAEGLYAMVDTLPGNPDPKDVTVSIQGIGEVGYNLAARLLKKGVNIVIAEVNQAAINNFKKEFASECASGQAKILDDPNAIYDVKANIFCPCALRDVLSEETLPRFVAAGVQMIGGPANNIFVNQLTGPWLFQNAGISVVPYEGIGAGGVTGVSQAIMTGFFGKCPFDHNEKVIVIGKYVAKILKYAQTYNLPAQVISDRILINGYRKRTFFDRIQAFAFMEKLAEAIKAGGAYETSFVNSFTKKGFFNGVGKCPDGGWKYLEQ